MVRFALAAACLVALFGAAASSAPLRMAPQELAALRDAGRAAGEQADRARSRAAELDRAAREARNAEASASLKAAALAARVQEQEATIAAADAQQRVLAARRAALSARLARQRAPVTQLMAGLQSLVRRPPVLALMQPLSLEETVHLRAVLAAVGPQIRERTAALQSEVAKATALEREAALLARQRREVQAGLEKDRAALMAAAATEQMRAQRAAGAADREAERAFAMAEKARSLGDLVTRIENPARSPHVSSPEGLRALFRPPVVGVAEPAARGPGKGITYRPAPGALVVAPREGRIAFVGPYRGYGRVIIIEHPDGWTSLLTGLGATQVATGQPVVAGSPLGRAPADLPAITLELRRDGAPMSATEAVR